MQSSKQYPRICEYYKDKSIFITGATGFIGKVLIEKLLRCCPDVKNIYLLMRAKKGVTAEKRLDKLFSRELFSRLKNEAQNDWRSKVKMVTGDVNELNLGIFESERKSLIDDVNIFFHIAASVRFDEPFKNAIITNTRGTREACNLALEMKNIEMFLHVSTTYCNDNRAVVDEKLYPPIADWKEMIHIAENMNMDNLQIISPKLMGPFPNTYTFSKNLAEHVVKDLCDGHIPATVVRPSIVISSLDDPFPGWIDNFNGPAGMLVGSGKGIVRSVLTKEEVRMDYIPVDFVVKIILGILAFRGTREDNESLKKLQVFNLSADLKFAITLKRLVELTQELTVDIPVKDPLWYPHITITSSKTYYFLQILLFHLLPAVFIDLILRILGKKPMLFQIQKKIYVACCALQYFIDKEWIFINEKAYMVRKQIKPEDAEDFSVTLNIDFYQVFKSMLIGSKKYLLHENMDDLEKNKRRLFRMKILYYLTKSIFWALIIYFIYNRLYLIGHVLNLFVNYWQGLKV